MHPDDLNLQFAVHVADSGLDWCPADALLGAHLGALVPLIDMLGCSRMCEFPRLSNEVLLLDGVTHWSAGKGTMRCLILEEKKEG